MTIHKDSKSCNTQIAFAETQIEDLEVFADYFVNRIGGPPTSLVLATPDHQYPPPPAFPHFSCARCHAPLYLLSQLHAPSTRRDRESVLYLFGCNTNACMLTPGSFKAVRGTLQVRPQRKNTTATPAAPPRHSFQFQAAWPSSSAPPPSAPAAHAPSLESSPAFFGFHSDATLPPPPSPPQLPLVAHLSHKSTPDTDPSLPFIPPIPTFPSYYLAFEEEVLLTHPREPTPAPPASADATDEPYEKPKRRFPKQLQTFLKRVAHHPQQVLRYEGLALPYSAWPVVHGAPACPCGGHWVFKYQIMPGLLAILPTERMAPTSLVPQWHNGMEFGTVLVFTCENECLPIDSHHPYIEEQCIVHLEKA